MFVPEPGKDILQNFPETKKNLVISKNDRLELEVFSNAGETKPAFPSITGVSATNENQDPSSGKTTFLVDDRGIVKFPIIQEIKLEGLSLSEAEKLLENEYSKFVTSPFVKLNYSNKRVIVLGATGGKVIPLTNPQMKLSEILALANGLPENGNAGNIRVLRNNDVIIADLSTIAGYRKNNITIQPDDIIYIEPVRRPLSEGLRDYGPVLSIITSLAALIVVLVGVN